MDPHLLFVILAVLAGSAVVINSFFILIVLCCSPDSMGFYKWFLIGFGLFEGLYATVVFLGLPVHLVADNSWIVFSYGSLLEHTSLSHWGPGLYCAFYELWIGLVVTLFIYRYVVVCLSDLKEIIIKSHCLKIFILLLYLTHFTYCVVCGLYWCTRNAPSMVMQNTVKEQFDIEDFGKLGGYMLMGFKNPDGSFSPAGSISIINHYILVVFSGIIICFCSIRIWRKLSHHSKQPTHLPETTCEIHLHQQIFTALVLQLILTLLGCLIPTMVFLTYPLWPAESKFGSEASIFSVLTTIPKVLDPIVTILCIRDYRRAVFRF